MKQIERALSEIHIYAVFICSRSRPISGRGVIAMAPPRDLARSNVLRPIEARPSRLIRVQC